MEKIRVEVAWNRTEELSLVKAYKGHYTVEFTFKGQHYYLVNDYTDKDKDIRVFAESEFLLADEPEAIYRVHGKEEGKVANEMFSVIWEAMRFGKEKAESGIAHLTLGY